MSAKLQIQVVVYENDLRSLWRLIEALGASAAYARDHGILGETNALLGDCSPTRVLATDDVRDLESVAAASRLDSLSYEFFGANLGSAGGSNRLAKDCTADLILILNPDTYPSPRMLYHLVDAMSDGVAIVEGRQIPLEHPKAYDTTTGDTSWASGCCMLVRRTVFEEVGGFDTDHFMLHCDDVDFSWRCRLAGYRVVHAPRAVLFHDKRITTSGTVEAPGVERYHGLLGRLMLAHRYGRMDLVERVLATATGSDDRAQLRALDEYERRVSDSLVPEPVAGAERVATFVGGEYAEHRF